MACFTHYWAGSTCSDHLHLEGKPLIHTAGNLFKTRGVSPGDTIYVVNISQGSLHLVGRMQVGTITSKAEAERILKEELWPAMEHLLAVKGSGTPMRFERIVPLEITAELLFESRGRYETLKYEAPGLLDRQTLRGVRRLADSSGPAIDKFMAQHL